MEIPNIDSLKTYALSEKSIKKKYPEFYDFLIKKYAHINPTSFQELLWLFKNNLKTKPVCPICKINELRFENIIIGYTQYCSVSCSNKYHGRPFDELKEIYGNITELTSDIKIPQNNENNPHHNREDYIKKHYPKFYIYLCNKYKNVDGRFSEKLYMFRHNLDEPPKCVNQDCDNFAQYDYIHSIYNECCSRKCMDIVFGKKRISAMHKSYEEKTGYSHPMKDPVICAKSLETNRNNHGGILYIQTQEFIDYNNTFGKERIERMNNTLRKRTGNPNLLSCTQIPEIAKQISKTKQQKYLDEHPDIIKYTDDDKYLCKCPHPDSDCKFVKECKDRTFTIHKATYWDRKSENNEICTILNKPHSNNYVYFSQAELDDRAILDNLGIKYTHNDRETIDWNELDIYCPDQKIAIEENGVWCHCLSCKKRKIDDLFHIRKWKKCFDKGIELIYVWSDWSLDDKTKFLSAKFKNDWNTIKEYKQKWFPNLNDNEWPLDLGFPPGFSVHDINLNDIRKHFIMHSNKLCSDSGVLII